MADTLTQKNIKSITPLHSIKESDVFNSGLFKSYPDLLLILDKNAVIESVFSNFPKDFFNHETPERGKSLFNYFVIEEENRFKKALLKAVKSKKIEKLVVNSTVNGVKKIYDARLLPSYEELVFVIIREITKNKIAEDALKLSELRFRSIWENSIDGMCMTDLTGTVIAVNKSLAAMFEVEPGQLVGKDISQIPVALQDIDSERFFAALKHNLLEKITPSFYEIKAVSRTGKFQYLEMFNIIIDSIEDKIYEGDILNLCIFRDISERKFAEEILKQSEKHYRTLVETSPDAILMLDCEGNILNCNRQVYRLFSNPDIKCIVGSNICEFVIEEDKERINEGIKHIISQRILRNVEYSIVAGPGKTIPVEINASLNESITGTDNEIIAVVRDISDRKAAQSALVRSEMQFRSIWEHSHDGMRLTDENGIVLAVNPAFAEMVGTLPESLVGKSYFDVYDYSSEDNKSIKIKKYKECFKKKDFRDFFTPRPKLKSGNYLIVDVKFSLIDYSPNKPVLLSIFRDITERTKAEENLRDSEKLAGIGKMAAYISHEIRTPLASIGLNLEMLYRDLVLPPRKQRNWDIIHREIKRLNNLVKNILLFSKTNNDLVLVRVNFRNLISAAKDLLEPTLSAKNINLINRIVNLEFMADYQKIQTIVIHLIENAVEAIGQNGDIEIYSEEESGYHNIYIKDNGPGLECASRIFEPFYTTKHSGTGLGLSIVKKIMESHNGKVALVSSKKGETIFCLSFLK
jgi:two-component system, sporulation sensor kinase E